MHRLAISPIIGPGIERRKEGTFEVSTLTSQHRRTFQRRRSLVVSIIMALSRRLNRFMTSRPLDLFRGHMYVTY